MLDDLWAAFALYLILEGLLPALVPERWREAMRAASQQDPRAIRVAGIATMVAGAVLLHLLG
ncbi:MAG: DUF2065 domain-containing protein [Xanthomonadales bacterium]|jgi:uncharacterized protein YjeT (DUF2065 family)|nr:DUF2065 domain-containing protein [Xanthomonadales bacterium]